MTIAISLVVGDGIVLGTDSATSIILPGEKYYNIYPNAEKTINLVKGLPIGLMTYGLGSISNLSIASLGRILRDLLSGTDGEEEGWALDPATYSLEYVARLVKEFFYENLYVNQFGKPAEDSEEASPPGEDETASDLIPKYPSLGFIVAGFSAGMYYPEVWTVEVGADGRCEGPTRVVSPGTVGVIRFWGQPEPLNRLVYGWSEEAASRLREAGIPENTIHQILISETPLAHPGMPVQDAIDLVLYLAEVTAGYVRFKPGAPVVGPPFDIAAITRHQGFRWVSRKHYFSKELNPVDYAIAPRHPQKQGGADAGQQSATDAEADHAAGSAAPDNSSPPTTE